jgi:hypothetical protein
MNKLMTTALVAGGLMLMNSPEAAAHKEVRNVYEPPAYYQTVRYADYRRSKDMPRWLKHDRSFHKWYKHTRLRRDRRLAWNQLFDIYRWERRWGKVHYQYRYRDHDHNSRDRRRHRH